LGVKRNANGVLDITVVTSFRPGASHNSILAARCMYPSTFSQLISKPYHYTLFKVRTDIIRTSVGFRNISGMVQQPFSDAASRSHRKRACAPGEGQDYTRLGNCYPLKPPLKGTWEFTFDFLNGTRKRNVTEGHAQGLHLVTRPIRTSRAGSGYPLPENPATMLLRKTTGNETTPNCLPDSSLGIDLTPMGFLPLRLFSRIGRMTYYTAKK